MLVYSDSAELQAVAYPLVGISLMDQPRTTVFETPISAVLPKVLRLDNVGIR